MNLGINPLGIISAILILIAIIFSVLIIILLIGWLYSGDNIAIALPGLGLIISISGIIILLLIMVGVSVLTAAFIKPKSEVANQSKVEQNYEYPNDIFSGCGNGTLTLFLVKDPKNYATKTDRDLKICFNDDDMYAIQDSIVTGRLTYENLTNSADFQKTNEYNQQVHQKFASIYPMLGRINDMYQDYVFNLKEIS